MIRKQLSIAAKVVFGCAMLWLVARGLDPAELADLARRGDPVHLANGLASLLLAMMVFQWSRLHVLVKRYVPSLRASLEMFYVGALFNNLLPSNIGGDAIRLVYLKRFKADNWGTPFMLLLLHRLSGFFVLWVMGLSYLAFEHERLVSRLAGQGLGLPERGTTFVVFLGLGALVLALAGALVVRRLSTRLRERVLGFVRNCRAAFDLLSARDALALMVHTLLFHGFRVLAFYELVRYLGQHVSYWDLVFVVSATGIVAVLPLTVAGLGIIEGSISGLLVMYGVDASAAVAVALVNRLVLLLMAAIGGVVYVAAKPAAEVAPAQAGHGASAPRL